MNCNDNYKNTFEKVKYSEYCKSNCLIFDLTGPAGRPIHTVKSVN